MHAQLEKSRVKYRYIGEDSIVLGKMPKDRQRRNSI
jgi:hypothetical protein